MRDNNPALHYIVLRVQKPNRMAEQASHTRIRFSGGHNEKETPVPIPNTAVKLLSADDTWLETARENRSLPELYQGPVLKRTGLLLCQKDGLAWRKHDIRFRSWAGCNALTRPQAGADKSASVPYHRAPAPSVVQVVAPSAAFGHHQSITPCSIPTHDIMFAPCQTVPLSAPVRLCLSPCPMEKMN